ncbi:MAG TPA: DMT family transporter [Bacteroidota bacterium]|nr:DMT family transporter [Bacteroidota bacterium]
MKLQRRAEFLLLSITVVWGSTFVITKSLLEENTPFLYTGVRFFLAAALLFAAFPKRIIRITRSSIRHGIILGIFLYVGFVLQTIGIQYTTASKAAFFTGMLTVFTPLVQYFLQHFFKSSQKYLRIGNMVGAVLAGGGLYLLTSPAGGGFTIGDAMSLACALMFAFYIVYLDYASSEPDKMPMTFVMFLVCGIGGVAGAGLAEPFVLMLSTRFVVSLLYLTIFATVITMAIQNRYQGDTTPARAAVIFALEPVVAAVFAFFVRGEELGVVGISGGIAVVGGLLVSEFSEEIPFLGKVLR